MKTKNYKNLQKLNVETESMHRLETFWEPLRRFQSHEIFWQKEEAFILSVVDSRQRFPALEVKIKLSAMPLEGIALSVVSFFLLPVRWAQRIARNTALIVYL